jgi:hypothetical protein
MLLAMTSDSCAGRAERSEATVQLPKKKTERASTAGEGDLIGEGVGALLDGRHVSGALDGLEDRHVGTGVGNALRAVDWGAADGAMLRGNTGWAPVGTGVVR